MGRCLGFILALILALVFVSPASAVTNHQQFGVAISSGQSTIANTYAQTGISWWYVYGLSTPTKNTGNGNGVGHIAVNPNNRIPVATLQAGAIADPGGVWLIGNEPNVPGQDNISPAVYATELHYYATTIFASDPTAKLVGPNVLNWDVTCITGCGGWLSGHSWTDQFRLSYINQYGVSPPLAGWGFHLYPLDWYNLPMGNANDIAINESEATAFSSYLTGLAITQPIWITEFGSVWNYDGYNVVSTGCAAPPNCFQPTGPYDQAAVSNYVTTFVNWLQTNGPGLHITKWFIFNNAPFADTFATAPAGIYLLTDTSITSTLTATGVIYKQLAQ